MLLFIKRRKLLREPSGSTAENKEIDSYHIFDASGENHDESLAKNANALSSHTNGGFNFNKNQRTNMKP